MKRMLLAVVLVGGLVVPAQCLALPGIEKLFLATYPAAVGSQLADCRTCHLPTMENCLNDYALALKEAKLDFHAVEEMDSDGDGVSNIYEIRAEQLPGSQAEADEVFVFHNRMGSVTFDHQKHSLAKAYLSEGACDNCHAPDKFPKKFDDRKSLQMLAHPICRGCHQDSGSDKAPTHCRQCHQR